MAPTIKKIKGDSSVCRNYSSTNKFSQYRRKGEYTATFGTLPRPPQNDDVLAVLDFQIPWMALDEN